MPWQGDTAFCRSGYEPEFDPYILSFWPARVPNQVLAAVDYAIVMDFTKTRQVRRTAYNRRRQWTRSLTGPAPDQMRQMVQRFGSLGIVEMRPGVPNDPDFPPVMFVESLPQGPAGMSLIEPTAPIKSTVGPGADETDPVRAAGWESSEQLEEFRRILRRKK